MSCGRLVAELSMRRPQFPLPLTKVLLCGFSGAHRGSVTEFFPEYFGFALSASLDQYSVIYVPFIYYRRQQLVASLKQAQETMSGDI